MVLHYAAIVFWECPGNAEIADVAAPVAMEQIRGYIRECHLLLFKAIDSSEVLLYVL